MVQILSVILAVAYPVLVFCFLVILKMPARAFSLFVVAAALVSFLALSAKKKPPAREGPESSPGQMPGKARFSAGPRVFNVALLGAVGLLCFFTNSPLVLKLYPVLMNALFLFVFGGTLFFPPVMVFRLAVLQDRGIRGSLAEKRIEAYCRKVTMVWCAFFVLNGGVAAYSVFRASDAFWSLYNGGISYILIGILFAGEFSVRKITDKKMPKAFPLSQFTAKSRPPETVLCYEQTWGSGAYKTWQDFLDDSARLRALIRSRDSEKWILHVEDCWHFLAAFAALLQCKKEIHLTANISPAYIREIRGPGVAFLTDRAADAGAEDVTDIQGFLASPESPGGLAALRADPVPSVNADETVIIMYTSGTTGKPKAVRQRLTEFENDNRFILSKCGEEFLKRKLCSTVSQHHIYGLLFSILLPFTAAVPFRRRRIEFPEEFLKFNDTSYMIITVPAFLKRAVEQFGGADAAPAGAGALELRDPWIFTSGGAVPPETAKKTRDIFGFWPFEVYGSTETSGIAYRQSKNGMEWTPFENARISKNGDGCLVIRSPYIKDPAGFTTGDLVDILPDGRFILKGRADSVVKIEEKRISLPEIESRILQTGLVSDVCAVALEDRRQYLAAALALNSLGRERFSGKDKAEINRYFTGYLLQFFENTVIPKKWRYLDALPLDAQGKKKKPEIEALFAPSRNGAVPQNDAAPAADGAGPFMHAVSGMREIPRETVLEQAADQVLLEFSVPRESGYFQGHFPGYSILPGVAQLEMAMRLASRYFGTGIFISRFRRIKFSAIIRPDVPLRMKLVHNAEKNELGFEIKSPDGDTVYSSGTVSLGTADMSGSPVRQGFLIPVYNHGKTAVSVVQGLAHYGLPIILVDDGSDAETKGCLAKIAADTPGAILVTREKNGGKGAAVIAGMDRARSEGLTHVMQIDADGQHDAGRAGFFLEQSAAHPEALICGWPEFDGSVPPSRKNGRKIANAWAKIVTLSSDIRDILCGFRVYPVEPAWQVCRHPFIDKRMGFDTEIIVRLHWKHVPLLFYPVRVSYPPDGVSHFRPVRDNIRISLGFTRLCAGMLVRLPLLLAAKFRAAGGEGDK
ncbi:MAG: AMP-binding protein [Treponema sp.]|jgi:uncharacterized membrane protein/acyl-CoA synthetase (AMP-forming)/AMP-acid ligase II/3-hydroxymyristoyl/3-hydroxydecanoyl-(acyl carrier protein) dehydratase|nr:AMP-binding protein [Treponema sp.]